MLGVTWWRLGIIGNDLAILVAVRVMVVAVTGIFAERILHVFPSGRVLERAIEYRPRPFRSFSESVLGDCGDRICTPTHFALSLPIINTIFMSSPFNPLKQMLACFFSWAVFSSAGLPAAWPMFWLPKRRKTVCRPGFRKPLVAWILISPH